MIEGVESFGLRGNRCHSSSVTKGINGCSNRRPKSRQLYNVFWADLRVMGSSVSGFAASYKSVIIQTPVLR